VNEKAWQREPCRFFSFFVLLRVKERDPSPSMVGPWLPPSSQSDSAPFPLATCARRRPSPRTFSSFLFFLLDVRPFYPKRCVNWTRRPTFRGFLCLEESFLVVEEHPPFLFPNRIESFFPLLLAVLMLASFFAHCKARPFFFRVVANFLLLSRINRMNFSVQLMKFSSGVNSPSFYLDEDTRVRD